MFKTNFKEIRILRKNKSFSEETRRLFDYCYDCSVCGMNNWDALHHIFGGNFDEADSPLNACPIHNDKCHVGRGHQFSKHEENLMLVKTLKYLFIEKYKFTQKDLNFIKKYEDRYLMIGESRELLKIINNK